MRFFTYKAADAKGRAANGTIQAASVDEARLALVRAGWTVYDVQPSGGGQPGSAGTGGPPAGSKGQSRSNSAVPGQPLKGELGPPASSTDPSRSNTADGSPPLRPATAGPAPPLRGGLGPPARSPGQPQSNTADGSPPLRAKPAAASVPLQSAGGQQGQIVLNSAPAQAQPSQRQPAPVVKIQAPSQRPVIRTKRGSDKERFFLFSQLAAAFRSGLNPVTTFNEIASRSRANFHESLMALANTAVEGGSLSRTMSLYPDLYPEHVVGLTEAGQQGGFLPDAFEQISLQAQSAHKFKKWFFWIWLVFVNTLLLLPGMWWTTRSLLKAWEIADASGGSEGAASAGRAFWQTLIWPIGPAFLLLCFFCWATYTYLGSKLAKRFRHRIGLRAPVYGKRARHENLSIFSWTLARLSHSGLPPSTAYRLAAETAPNLEMRDELLDLANRLSGAEKMSQIIGGSRLFPDEYVPVIATAEYTGDLPAALQQLSDMSRDEFQTAETYAKMRSGCWGMLAFGVVGGLAMAMLMYTWYHELPAKILKDFEWLVL